MNPASRHLLAGLACHEATCIGTASVVASTGAVLASGHYSMAQRTKEPVALTLRTKGAIAFAQAWKHPVRQKLLVTVRRRAAAAGMVRVS